MRYVSIVVLLAACLGAVLLSGGIEQARAATCSDFPNQAAAQRAANTRDGDGDGVYCESLPCPCLGAGGGGSGGGSGTPPPAAPSRAPACGVERWAVKTLQDPGAGDVNRVPRNTSIARIRQMPVSGSDAKRTSPFETTTWRVRVRLIAAKIEDDSDVHLVIADPASGGTMIAEIPKASCAPRAPSWAKRAWTRARRALAACGAVSHSWTYYPAGASAVITGVGFADRLHGQKGVAPNGAELHPVSSLRSLRCG